MEISQNVMTRRNFTKLSAGVIASTPLLGFAHPLLNLDGNQKDALTINLFSKHVQFLDYSEMAAVTKEMGFNGLDITVRPGGHVLPEKVETDLFKVVTAMNKHDISPGMMTTNVWDTDDPLHQDVLRTASELGFSHYRTGWLKYPEERTIAESQLTFGSQAATLEKLNKELNIIGCYQNHAGNHVGAPVWDIPSILSLTQNEHMGCQYDIRHAVVEGGASWELGLRKIKPFIKSLVLKDFKWGKVNGQWKPVNTPLGEGMVDFKKYFSLLKKYKINVPVSLHFEYDLGGAEHGASAVTMNKNQIFAQMKKDLDFVKYTWENAE